MNTSNWPHGTNMGESNWTGKAPRVSKWQGGGWAPDSETPPWGWPVTLVIAAAVVAVLIFGVSYVGTAAGF